MSRTRYVDLPSPADRAKAPSRFSRITLRAVVVVLSCLALRFPSVVHAIGSPQASTTQTTGDTTTIRVELKLRTGATLRGTVVDHNDDAIVVVNKGTPYVAAWMEIKTQSAYVAKRELLALRRGGNDQLTAADHYELGVFVLSRGRDDLARSQFNRSARLDPTYKKKGDQALTDARSDRRRKRDNAAPLEPETGDRDESGIAGPSLADRLDQGIEPPDHVWTPLNPTPSDRERIRKIYLSFGESVRDQIAPDLTLMETEHFLIWTDWAQRDRLRLSQWCEAMYTALCHQFDLDPTKTLFLAKCPIFCWRSGSRFRKFAKTFDGYSGADSIGYTRSIEKNGHVHLALLRRGRSPEDFDLFASTLVHEGTHAFVHRLFSTRLIPHWVNEGLAELMAERVLGDRCPAGEKASLLARQYARYNWSVGAMLSRSKPIEVHEYALAHSLIEHLESSGRLRFADFIRRLKNGETLIEAVSGSYDGMTLSELESSWRKRVAID